MDKRTRLEEQYSDEELVFADGFDEAILGATTLNGIVTVCYDKVRVLEILAEQMEEDEALDYYYFNVEGSDIGPGSPLYIDLIHP